jgi:hypothetical protein
LSRERNSCVQGCVRRLMWAAIGSIMLIYAARFHGRQRNCQGLPYAVRRWRPTTTMAAAAAAAAQHPTPPSSPVTAWRRQQRSAAPPSPKSTASRTSTSIPRRTRPRCLWETLAFRSEPPYFPPPTCHRVIEPTSSSRRTATLIAGTVLLPPSCAPRALPCAAARHLSELCVLSPASISSPSCTPLRAVLYSARCAELLLHMPVADFATGWL